MNFRIPINIVLLLLGLTVVLTGCWDRREINDVSFVLGTGLDKDKDGQLRYSVIVPLPGQMGGATGGGGGTSGTKSFYIESDTGATLREAWAKIQKRMPRQMYFSHRRVIIIGEDYAKDGLTEVFDLLFRQPESRMSVFMIVAEGSALDLMKAEPKLERFSVEAIRELAVEPRALPVSLKNVSLWLANEGADPLMLYMGTKRTVGGSKEVEVKGYAQFRGDKMVGVFEGDNIAAVNWLRNRFAPYNLTVRLDEGRLINIEVFSGKTDIRSSIRNDGILFDVNVAANIRIFESTAALSSYKATTLKRIEEKISEHIRKSLQTTVSQIQTVGADSAGFGMLVYREHPQEWKNKFRDDWQEHLRRATFRFKVNSEISETGLIFENMSERTINK